MRIARIAAVTAGLVAAGAVAGAVVSTAMGMLWHPLDARFLPDAFRFGVGIGAPMGAVLGPIAAWLLMLPGIAYMGAVLGFGVAAVYLSVRTPSRDSRIAAPADPSLPES